MTWGHTGFGWLYGGKRWMRSPPLSTGRIWPRGTGLRTAASSTRAPRLQTEEAPSSTWHQSESQSHWRSAGSIWDPQEDRDALWKKTPIGFYREQSNQDGSLLIFLNLLTDVLDIEEVFVVEDVLILWAELNAVKRPDGCVVLVEEALVEPFRAVVRTLAPLFRRDMGGSERETQHCMISP